MRGVLKAGTALAVTLVAVTTTAFAASIDYQAHGFGAVAAQATIPAGQGATIQVGGATVTVSAGTFTDPVKFEFLEGPLVSFTSQAPSGQSPIFDFAFKVIDQKTNAIVMKFAKPVMFSYTNQNVNSHSLYYNISPSGSYALNPVNPVIQGNTFKHGIAGAVVGWAITSPVTTVKQTTSPITGLPLTDWLLTGAALIFGGGVLLAVRRKITQI
jgi:hypothetical protein